MEQNTRERRLDVESPSGKRYTYLIQKELGSGNCVVYLARALSHEPSGDHEAPDYDHPDKRPPEYGHSEQTPEEREAGAAMRWVAIKVAHSLQWKGYLATEAALLKRLQPVQHQVRRVVRIGAEGEVLEHQPSGRALIELEHLNGVTLEEWFRQHWSKQKVTALDAVEKTCELVQQLAEALVELSRVEDGILHRDLKPANVMVTGEGLRLFDFNAAREAVGENKTQNVGTQGYQAPEVLLSEQYDQRADLYSLGVIVWELLFQKRLPRGTLPVSLEPFCVPWPQPPFQTLDPMLSQLLQQLLTGLLVDQARRLKRPEDVLDLVHQLQAVVRGLRTPREQEEAEILRSLDLIELIRELRPGGQNSVVADVMLSDPRERFVREHTRVREPLEDWLHELVKRSMEGAPNAPRLLILAGNAGDGKSYLIQSLLTGLKQRGPDWRERLVYIADATHATRPDEDQSVRLSAFFAPFANQVKTRDRRFHLIAMNTGMVVRFFEEAQRAHEADPRSPNFSQLYETLRVQLGLMRSLGRGTESRAEYKDVMVVNLDLRSMVAESEGQPSFLSRMLDRLNPAGKPAESLVAVKSRECEQCPARSRCPVRFNLEALASPVPRQALLTVLRRAALDPEVHLSPRSMWGFLNQLVTGGERYQAEVESCAHPCDEVRRRSLRATPADRTWLLNGHFYQLLFSSERREGLWSALRQLDPAYASIAQLDQLHTRLTVQPDLDQQSDFIRTLGGDQDELLGLSLKSLLNESGLDLGEQGTAWRRDSAVRRQVMFDRSCLEAYQQDGAFREFETLLEAYQEYSLKASAVSPQFAPTTRTALLELTKLVQDVVIRGYGFRHGEKVFLRVSQPIPLSTSQLLVQVDQAGLSTIFGLKQLVRSDIQIDGHLLTGREVLLTLLGHRPRMVTLSVRNHRLMVDRDLYNFLQQVKRGQQPSTQDLAQFQTIRFAGEKLGNHLAQERSRQTLFVLERGSEDQRRLYRLTRDEFGELHMMEEKA